MEKETLGVSKDTGRLGNQSNQGNGHRGLLGNQYVTKGFFNLEHPSAHLPDTYWMTIASSRL